MNTSTIGARALGRAISYFSSLGYTVSLPLIDAQSYDLIVDWGGKLYKVQCKWTANKDKWKHFQVHLQTYAYGKVTKIFDKDVIDWLWVSTPEGDWLIDTNLTEAKTGITLSAKYQGCFLGDWFSGVNAMVTS